MPIDPIDLAADVDRAALIAWSLWLRAAADDVQAVASALHGRANSGGLAGPAGTALEALVHQVGSQIDGVARQLVAAAAAAASTAAQVR